MNLNQSAKGEISLRETDRIEFKRQVTDDIVKEVIAFANSESGTIYIGVADDGTAVGLPDFDAEYTRLTNMIRDSIVPDVTLFVHSARQDGDVIRVEVNEGSSKPYYLKKHGLKPSGVYVRQGTSSVQASTEKIRQMIRDGDGNTFELLRSMEQNLTFVSAQETFSRYHVPFDASKYVSLGLENPRDHLYTNLALLLSDQCQHTTKIAVFSDLDDTEFRDQKEFGGSLFSQMDSVYQYLRLCNRVASRIVGLERFDSPDYPEEALREAFLNALVHRDYSFSGSIIININHTKTEFISLGGLMPGLSEADIRSGISQPRNRNLAEVFHRLRLIESYGTGIRRIFHLYKDCPVEPEIHITPNTFRLVLPNQNECAGELFHSNSAVSQMGSNPQQFIILKFIRENGSVTEQQAMELLNVKKTRAYTVLREMVQSGLLIANGRGVTKKYLLCK